MHWKDSTVNQIRSIIKLIKNLTFYRMQALREKMNELVKIQRNEIMYKYRLKLENWRYNQRASYKIQRALYPNLKDYFRKIGLKYYIFLFFNYKM